jgi:hypothetical protein
MDDLRHLIEQAQEAGYPNARVRLRTLTDLLDERDRYGEALEEIRDRKIPTLNPDGVDQAAEEMALIARDALGPR